MATAISFRSESGDDYLSLFDKGETQDQMVEALKKDFDSEWAYLYIKNVESTDMNNNEKCQFGNLIQDDIEAQPQED